MAQEQITSEMTIDEIFSNNPGKAQKLAMCLTKAGLNCVGCSASTHETLEAGVMKHGLGEEFLTKILGDLNAILMEKSDHKTITLTPKAAIKFKEIAKEHNKENAALRIDEVPAGCSGFEYVLEFSELPRATDRVIVSEGVSIHFDKRAEEHFLGLEIDFADGLNPGFKISNPNVKHSCGCGDSHNYS